MAAAKKPGPGWTKIEGGWAPHWFTFADFPGAQAVAFVFKTLAVLILVGGGISAVETANALHRAAVSGSQESAVVIGVVAGAIISAAAMAFFGYVLQLLLAIHFDTRYSEAVEGL